MISPCPYLLPHAFCYICSPLSSWGGEWQSGFGGTWCPSRVNPTQLPIPKCWERKGFRSNSDAYLTTHVLQSHGLAQRTPGVPADKNVPQTRICPSEALCHSRWSGSGETRTALVLNHRIDLICETFLGLSAVSPTCSERGGLASLSKFNFLKEHGITTACSACQAHLTFFCSLWDCCVAQKEAGIWGSLPLLFLHWLYGLLSLQHFHHIIQFWFFYLKRHLFNFTKDIPCDLQNKVFKIWGTCSGVKVTPWTEPAGKVALSGSWSIFSCTSEIFPSMNASKTKAPGGVSKTEGMHAALNTESQ